MKTKPKKAATGEPPIDWVAQRKFEAAIKWMDKLDDSPRYQGIIDLFTDDPYCVAYRYGGISFMRVLLRLASAGHPQAIRQLLFHVCEALESLEALSDTRPEVLKEFATRRADWPVMLCRHETTNKLVSSYLDRIQLGTACLINADGTRVAKYSLRTPINRFVWRKLKSLRFSIGLLTDVPAIARIDLDALPKLTKATAKIWTDKALMPYIALCEDFSQVPEFRTILSRPGIKTRGQQRREIRKDVLRALHSLAPAA